MIPKPQHNDPLASQKFRARSIANLANTIVMPATIQFDRELCGRTIEIQDIAVQWMLTAEFVSLQNFGSANVTKECVQCRLPSFATNERGPRKAILVTPATFKKQDYMPASLQRRTRQLRGIIPQPPPLPWQGRGDPTHGTAFHSSDQLTTDFECVFKSWRTLRLACSARFSLDTNCKPYTLSRWKNPKSLSSICTNT